MMHKYHTHTGINILEHFIEMEIQNLSLHMYPNQWLDHAIVQLCSTESSSSNALLWQRKLYNNVLIEMDSHRAPEPASITAMK